jgi:hypothetical protein
MRMSLSLVLPGASYMILHHEVFHDGGAGRVPGLALHRQPGHLAHRLDGEGEADSLHCRSSGIV